MSDDAVEDGELEGCMPFRDSPADLSALDEVFNSYRAAPAAPDPFASYGAALERLMEPSAPLQQQAAPLPFRPPARPVATRSWSDALPSAPGPAYDAQRMYAPPRPRRQYNAVIFMRQRAFRGRVWFEYLLEFRNGAYQFPQVDTERVRPEEATLHLVHIAGQRGMLYAPEKPEEVESVYACTVTVDNTPHRVYRVPLHTTQSHRPERTLGIPPSMVWAAETEFAVHVQLGMPAVLGQQVCTRSLKALRQLPMELQFASATPPLVLYHGTTVAAANAIAMAGFKPGGGMLGPGVYVSKYDKAERFTRETADHVPRTEPGALVRVLLFAPLGAMKTMTETDACACATCMAGGGPRPFVDHLCVAGRDKPVTFVPDNSRGATRFAEWCVRDASLLMVDFLLADHGSGTARLRPKRPYP